MQITIEDTYTGVGQLEIHLTHDDKANSKQGLVTTVCIKADESSYFTAVAGMNDGGWLKMQLEGCEAVGGIKALRDVLDQFLNAVEHDIE